MTGLVYSELAIPGVLLVEQKVFSDPRGFFMETYHRQKYLDAGITGSFVQDNCSHSVCGVLRGLHYQLKYPQAKLVTVLRGSIFDVAVDIRRGSPTFGKWISQVISDVNRLQLYVPVGFAHGFCVLSEEADVLYKCTDLYHPDDDHGVLWCDPDLAIKWPKEHPSLSAKDGRLRTLSAIPHDELPSMARGPGR